MATLLTLREQIIAEAFTWIGTPYHHQAMLKQVGADCVGFPAGVGKACGLVPRDWTLPFYPPEWHLHHDDSLLETAIETLGCQARPLTDREPGDFLIFQYGRTTAHTAILVADDPEYIIHALLGRKITHQRLDGDVLRRLRKVYAFPGVRLWGA